VKKFKNKSGMTKFKSSDDSTSKGVLDVLFKKNFLERFYICAAEAYLSVFVMSGRTGPHNKGAPENVGRQRNIFCNVRPSLWRVATFRSLLGAGRCSTFSGLKG